MNHKSPLIKTFLILSIVVLAFVGAQIVLADVETPVVTNYYEGEKVSVQVGGKVFVDPYSGRKYFQTAWIISTALSESEIKGVLLTESYLYATIDNGRDNYDVLIINTTVRGPVSDMINSTIPPVHTCGIRGKGIGHFRNFVGWWNTWTRIAEVYISSDGVYNVIEPHQ